MLGSAKLHVFVNNEEDKNEELMEISLAFTDIAVVDARRPEHDRWRGCSFFAARRADGGSPAREAGAQVVVAAHDDGEEEAPAAAPHFALLRSYSKQTVNADVGCSKLRIARGEGSEGCFLATGVFRRRRRIGLVCLATLESWLVGAYQSCV